MNIIFVFTQNLKLKSLKRYSTLLGKDDTAVFITTHFLFENERKVISNMFNNSIFKTFADYLTDDEMSKCDIDSYVSDDILYEEYLEGIKRRKNELVLRKVLTDYPSQKKYIFSKDLGIDYSVWKDAGFVYSNGDYYYKNDDNLDGSLISKIKNFLWRSQAVRNVYKIIRKSNNSLHIPDEVSVAEYKGHKYVFLGKMSRIDYRLEVPFEKSEEECKRLNSGLFETKETCTYITTWHEHDKCDIPDDPKYAVRWAQDGYLPPNYTHKDYFFKPDNVVYYCWDELGTHLFRNQNLPYEMIPFRKKLYLPKPEFPKKVKNILIVASGSGDWTALKNRSDDDILVDAFVQIAKKFPDIHFTYRCHPTWVHPLNVGINSINRVNNYFQYLNLSNLTLSSNIPIANNGKEFQYSFSRSSLDDDLAEADFVFGEHSISMIDAAFRQIPFCSVNLTKRRNFFIDINELGFPLCTSIQEISDTINRITSVTFKNNFLKAIKNYNDMTRIDGVES